ncbi:MAG: hypothetical protein AAB911_02265 [Patescibacteria group bacterium]
MKTATVSNKLPSQVKAFIFQTIQDVLNDPDLGLVLSQKAKNRLNQARISKVKDIPFSEIKKRYCPIGSIF